MKGSCRKKILLAPLDWGLGHLTRCLPVIKKLSESYIVDIACKKDNVIFLKKYFPNLNYHKIVGYNINYHNINQLSFFKHFFNLIKIFIKVKKEKNDLNKILKANHFDLIISDNRYGFYSKEVPSIIISHQLRMTNTFFSTVANLFIKNGLTHFKKVWVPDYLLSKGLSGILSEKPSFSLPVNTIGLLSRFDKKKSFKNYYKTDIFCIVSGPDPQKGKFLNFLTNALKKTNYNATIAINSNPLKITPSKQLNIVSNMSDDEFIFRITNTPLVVSRGGYSTLMDLAFYNKSSLLIPTPKQPEQIYLAKYHSQNNNHIVQNQNNICFKKAMLEIKKLRNTKYSESFFLFKEIIQSDIQELII